MGQKLRGSAGEEGKTKLGGDGVGTGCLGDRLPRLVGAAKVRGELHHYSYHSELNHLGQVPKIPDENQCG